MIVLRSKYFSKRDKDEKDLISDPKPRMYNREKGNVAGAAIGTGIGAGFGASMGSSISGGLEIGKMYKEAAERVMDGVRAGDPRAEAAYMKMANGDTDFLTEFVNRAKKAKPGKGAFLNRYNRARLKGAAIGASIPLALGGLNIAEEVSKRNLYKKDKEDFDERMSEWKKRNNK